MQKYEGKSKSMRNNSLMNILADTFSLTLVCTGEGLGHACVLSLSKPSRSPSTGLGEAAVTGGHTNTTGWPEPQGALLRTETPVAGEPHSAAPHTDATDAVTADPKGVRDGFSHLGTTPQTQSAVPAGEQYITSGQGPEGGLFSPRRLCFVFVNCKYECHLRLNVKNTSCKKYPKCNT
ncbi:uncharacterized protein LOC108921989 isoform X3 [Scleropages formosus]|uniref:uncharacterized protein LOC108921989 isoform X3 n=1 Tax=Scleropages formosus TaxID=113540 RepID=UPI0008783D55|nr:uncharacterized protein LOC108921989 isoform X3 [Scleropages formosus]